MTRKRHPLVVEHLEDISRKVLLDYQRILRNYVKGRFGIYALYRRNKLYYVGLASNLRNRLKSHLRDKHAAGWDRFSLYLTHSDQHLRELEALALRIAAPKGNISRTKFSQAKDLRKVLRRQIEQSQQAELAALFEYLPRDRSPAQRKKAPRRNKRVRISDVVEGRMPIRMVYRGRTHRAMIRKDGSIIFRRKRYNSPSAAARTVTGRASNGWYWWKYESAPDEWIRIRELR